MARKGLSGLPLYEIAASVVIAGIVIGFVSERIDTLLEQTEKVAVQTTIMNIRSGLRLEKARRIAAGQRLDELAGRNPLEFLEETGKGSEFSNLAKTIKTDGRWYVNDKNIIYYVPKRVRHLHAQQGGDEKHLAWQIQADKTGGQLDVVLITPYQWF